MNKLRKMMVKRSMKKRASRIAKTMRGAFDNAEKIMSKRISSMKFPMKLT